MCVWCVVSVFVLYLYTLHTLHTATHTAIRSFLQLTILTKFHILYGRELIQFSRCSVFLIHIMWQLVCVRVLYVFDTYGVTTRVAFAKHIHPTLMKMFELTFLF